MRLFEIQKEKRNGKVVVKGQRGLNRITENLSRHEASSISYRLGLVTFVEKSHKSAEYAKKTSQILKEFFIITTN